MRYALGIDLGGTLIKGALVNESGRVLLKDSRPTPTGGADPSSVVQALVALGRSLQEQAAAHGFAVEGIGFGQPNIVEGPDWVQRAVTNVPALEGCALRPPLAEAFGERIAMDNDVMNAAAAEYHFGEGHKYARAFFLSLGTGIAAGIFTENRKQLRYVAGWAGDTGHIIVAPLGGQCTCGGRGCLETVASGWAIRAQALTLAHGGKSPWLARRLAERGDLSPADAAEAAAAGDEAARGMWEEAGWYLGVALTSYLHIFDPHVILIGGGLAQAGDLLLRPIRRTIAALGSPYYLRHLQAVKQASLGADAGVIGAAALILRPETA